MTTQITYVSTGLSKYVIDFEKKHLVDRALFELAVDISRHFKGQQHDICWIC